MKKIAIITGASSGMGRVFANTVNKFGAFDEVWAVARRADRLEELKKTCPFPVRALSYDLTDRASIAEIENLLKTEAPDVGLLINCSGFGRFEATLDTLPEVNVNMVELNCISLMSMCASVIPFMKKGSAVINISSVAAFQPTPYINVYAATKAFVLSYSRALARELKKDGISVTAVCPFWTKTEFFDRAVNENNKVVKKYVAMYTPEQIVGRAWRDVKKKKDVSKFGFIARFQMGLAKILPHRIIMSGWLRQQKL